MDEEEFQRLMELLSQTDWGGDTGSTGQPDTGIAVAPTPTPTSTPTQAPWSDVIARQNEFADIPIPGKYDPLAFLRAQQLQIQQQLATETNPVLKDMLLQTYNRNATQLRSLEAASKPGTSDWQTVTRGNAIYQVNKRTGEMRLVGSVPGATSTGTAAANQNATTAAQRLAWEVARQAAQDKIAQEQYTTSHNWQLEAADQLRRQQVADAQALATARQREQQMANAQRLADMYQTAQIQSLPYMARPGQVYQTGGEPGGFYQNYLRGTGQAYNPESYKANIVQIDPYAAWRQAVAAMQQQAAQQQQGGGQ